MTEIKSAEIKSKEEYGEGYYKDRLRKMTKGYVHPYHTDDAPLYYSTYRYMRMLLDAVGPEQVSPHYETLARSRRGVLFLWAYTSVIVNISLLGGYAQNEWLREMVFHQEFLICMTLANTETRHFAWLPGPKFTIFY